MKKTDYFEHMRKRPDRARIREEWITHVIQLPEKTEFQSDGRIRKWAWIPEEGKFLRVILLEDGETVHNVDDFVKSRQDRRHSKKLQMQGARILRNEAYIEVRCNDKR